MAHQPLQLGLLGVGAAVRKLHLPALAKLRDEIAIHAVWSRSPERARAFADEVGAARVFADHRELLADPAIEAVLVAVPIEHNASMAIDAIAAGKHVLAEKPIAADVAEARRVLTACHATRRVVAIAENFRYRADILEAKRLIAAGVIGRVQCFQVTSVFDLLNEVRKVYIESAWRKEPQHPGGLVVDAGVHAVAGLREILGNVERVYAKLRNESPATSGADGLVMQMDLSSGASGQYLACYTAQTDRETVFELTVYGDGGTLWLTEGKVEYFSAATGKRTTWQAAPDRGYLGQWRNFLAAARGQETIYSTAQEAYGDLLVLERALESAVSGQSVTVEGYDWQPGG
ncbi:MAG TPA: Gfo/Idh/MocA family oxidoreductase [Pirellulales bacterium]|nr:Gfo/Idh/MocA family oxidoreductase [Pirellulales bacterium]